MFRKIIATAFASLSLAATLLPATTLADEACAPMRQKWSEGAGYEVHNPTVTYAVYNRQLVILEAGQREPLQVVEADYEVQSIDARLSPDCRYVVATVKSDEGSQFTTWDLSQEQRAGVIQDMVVSGYVWSPDSRYLLVQSDQGAHLWHVPSNHQMLLNANGDYGAWYHFQWDMPHQQLLIVPGNEGYKVRAYDLPTGSTVGEFVTGTEAAPVNFKLSNDGAKIAVFTSEGERFRDRRESGLAIWDRVGLYNITLNPERYAVNQPSQLSFSPDNRYLVIERDMIRVWDLQAVRADGLPNYHYDGPEARIGILRFVDAGTIETQYVGACNLCSAYWLRWNVVTGEFINGYDEPRDRIVTADELGMDV